jgi:hypothetical protein
MMGPLFFVFLVYLFALVLLIVFSFSVFSFFLHLSLSLSLSLSQEGEEWMQGKEHAGWGGRKKGKKGFLAKRRRFPIFF